MDPWMAHQQRMMAGGGGGGGPLTMLGTNPGSFDWDQVLSLSGASTSTVMDMMLQLANIFSRFEAQGGGLAKIFEQLKQILGQEYGPLAGMSFQEAGFDNGGFSHGGSFTSAVLQGGGDGGIELG